jgi:hypothetical protein
VRYGLQGPRIASPGSTKARAHICVPSMIDSLVQLAATAQPGSLSSELDFIEERNHRFPAY